MLTIYIPNKFSKEIKYTIDVLFSDFLDIKFNVIIDNDNDNFIFKYNKKSIIIKNQFFNKFNEQKGYLSKKNIPKQINYFNSEKYKIKNLSILFGDNKIEIRQNKIILHADIIASSFFMLSRWEEYVITKRDNHNRFSAKLSIAEKFNFLDRPIVNEYVDLLYKLLLEIGLPNKRKLKEFKIIPTHDVDIPFLWWSSYTKFKSIAISLYQKKYKEVIKRISLIFKGKDPYNTFDYLMSLSEKADVKSHFFFMSGGNTSYDNRYQIHNPRIKKLIKKIEFRNHYIGIHPSYNSYNNASLIENEKKTLSNVTKNTIDFGRHHYLRFEIPTTWQIWEDNHLKWDSTLTFADKSGFRCGVCYPFPVFNILTRKKLSLIERPLIVMESSIVGYEKLNEKQCIEKIKKLKAEVRKHHGEFVFLWHNSSFNTELWLQYKKVIVELYSK